MHVMEEVENKGGELHGEVDMIHKRCFVFPQVSVPDVVQVDRIPHEDIHSFDSNKNAFSQHKRHCMDVDFVGRQMGKRQVVCKTASH